MDNYYYPYPVMLYNPTTDELVNIESKDYRFSATAGETISLQLLFANDFTSIETLNLNDITIYGHNQIICVKASQNIQGTVTVYDINGQAIISDNMNGTLKEIPPYRKGVFIVHLQNDTQNRIQKLVF